MSVDCPNCREAVADGARFCPSCGTVVDGDAPADGTAVMEPVSVADEQDAADGRPARDREQPAPSGELRTCPACGADNSAARLLCARCGVDLDSGERPVAAPVVHRPGPPVDVAGDVSAAGRGNRTALVVAVIIVVGAIVGVLVGLWVVDAGRTPEAAAPTFDAGVYTGEPQTLEVTAVGASSERPAAGQTTYEAANLVDDDVTTAWSHDPAVEAAADVDLALALADPAWVTALTFANGAQADDLAFTDDGRVLRLMLLVDGSGAAELQLLDQPGLQRVTLPQPVLVDTIRLVVLEAVAGDTYDEVSMSEIVVTGHPARGEDLTRAISGGAATGE